MVSESRLVTLTGAAGVGKSRLAVRVADVLGRTFGHGAWLVELDHVTDRSLVPEAMASSLHVPDHSLRDAEEALGTFLAGRDLLLVVDNCEHVSESVAGLLGELLRRAPELSVLATSREVLGLPGEMIYRLEPLPLPRDDDDAAVVLANPAVSLFEDRARAAVHGLVFGKAELPSVVEICRRLDGIPLAIELAAAQLRVMSPADLAGRLDDRFNILAGRSAGVDTRHRTLRAAVEWSYELCDKLERLLWQRLSVFAGAFDLSDAEAVCSGQGLTQNDILEATRGLVDKSVLCTRVEPSGTTFRLLDTLRRYGLDRLAEEERDDRETGVGELQLRIRHLERYADLSTLFEEEWFGPGQPDRLARMRAKMPEIRAALGFAVKHPEHVRTGLRMAGALVFFWGTTAAVREGRSWLVRLLEVSREPSTERTRAMSSLAVLMVATGSPPDGGVAVVRETLDLARRDEPERVPRVLRDVGMMLLPHGDPEAMPALENAVARCRQRGVGGEELAYATYALGLCLGLTGQPERADALFSESIELCQEAGDVWWQGVVRVVAAFVAWANGDLDGAEINAMEGLRTCRLVPDLNAIAVGLNVLGLVLVGRKDRQAAALLGTAERYWADAGGSMFQTPVWTPLVDRARTLCRANLGEKEFEAAYRGGREESLEDATARTLGELTDRPERAHPAANLFGLTRRERDVVALIADGLSNREIAARLVISTRTAEAHVSNIFAKTGLSNRSQVAVWYSSNARA
jgi:predicted ATPase/DNA-binding CsgD family transcriptional regulator